MAESAVSDQNPCRCPVCLDRLKDPVTTACGHSYCKSCIDDCWNEEDQKGVYSCPQCRETFSPRPVLKKNTVLAELVDKLKIAEIQEAFYESCLAGPGDVECDVCTEKKLRAVKFCLVCLVSFCEIHVQPHYKSAAFKKHDLVEASADLYKRICSQHDRLLDVFCHTDQKCICLLCTINEHKGHDTVSAAAERNEKQMTLDETRKKSQQQIQNTEKELQELKKAVVTHRNCAQEAVKHSEMVFRELLQSIERCRSEVIQLIRDQEKAAVSQADKVIKDLEQEVAEMRRGQAKLDQLSHEEDHVHFLQSYQTLDLAAVCKHLPSVTFSPNLSFEDPRFALSAQTQYVEQVLQLQMAEITRQVGVGRKSFVTIDTGGEVAYENTMEEQGGAAYEYDGQQDKICPICMEEFIDEEKLPCDHGFCKDCLRQSVESMGAICPVCKKVFGKIVGDQPDGAMTYKYQSLSLPGFKGCGRIVIDYQIPTGTQSDKHPKPGRPFQGARRTAYLPDNKEGREVLVLLKRAFDQRLIFTVGISRTSGMDDCVIWNDIHHKTNVQGGAQNFGYPDDDYLKRVRDELKAKGIE
ncbi:E3 ubiquitin/ISG15 ligase TRIM25-like isoform X2 [Sardina pilchardus]|uniref:E3 ubiquitin/ISG15 ligase TRIM25-like isoform X2 n=1 Tax=Sardina pilchardus TaxID=27697 RepID=UPI002E108E49